MNKHFLLNLKRVIRALKKEENDLAHDISAMGTFAFDTNVLNSRIQDLEALYLNQCHDLAKEWLEKYNFNCSLDEVNREILNLNATQEIDEILNLFEF